MARHTDGGWLQGDRLGSRAVPDLPLGSASTVRLVRQYFRRFGGTEPLGICLRRSGRDRGDIQTPFTAEHRVTATAVRTGVVTGTVSRIWAAPDWFLKLRFPSDLVHRVIEKVNEFLQAGVGTLYVVDDASREVRIV